MTESIVPQNDQKITKFSDLKVGDEVFFVPNDQRYGRGPTVKTVTKIGRKYTYLGDIKIIAWSNNGYAIATHASYPHATIYASEQDYLEMHEWNTFCNSPSRDLSREQKRALLDFYKKLGGDV